MLFGEFWGEHSVFEMLYAIDPLMGELKRDGLGQAENPQAKAFQTAARGESP